MLNVLKLMAYALRVDGQIMLYGIVLRWERFVLRIVVSLREIKVGNE